MIIIISKPLGIEHTKVIKNYNNKTRGMKPQSDQATGVTKAPNQQLKPQTDQKVGSFCTQCFAGKDNAT